MKKNEFLLLLITFILIIYSCKNNENNKNSEIGTENKKPDSLEILNFDPSVIKKLPNIEGDLKYGYSWKDKNGLNQLVFTRATKFVQWKNEEEGMGDTYVYLKVYHFIEKEGNYSLLRMIQDGNEKGCSNPPFALECDFYKESISITDLDKDNYAEVTFMYCILCASELTPIPTKLMLLENGEKYAIRGTSYIPDFQVGGDKNIDESIKTLDQKIQDHVDITWEKFCKTNPNTNAQNTGSNKKISEIIGLKFGGTEPFWSIRFTDNAAFYIPNIGESEISLKYKDISVEKNKWSLLVENQQLGYQFSIVIRKEKCSDGMSDKIYPYSINLEFPDDTYTGCGGNSK